MEIFPLDLPGLPADGLVSAVMKGSRVGAFYLQLLSTVGQPQQGGVSRNRTRSKHDIIEHDVRERAESRSQVTVGGRGDCQAGQGPWPADPGLYLAAAAQGTGTSRADAPYAA